MSPRRSIYPPAAVDWMIPGQDRVVLDVGSGSGAFAAMIAAAGHRVHCVDSDTAKIWEITNRLQTAMHVVGKAEALPFDSCRFDVVTVQESITRFAPGLAVAEFARVLKPGGVLSVVFNSRDDTVPWVKRLAARMQADDPTAMQGNYGTETIAELEQSPYFFDLECKNFRNWIPINRPGLLAMVANRPAIAALPEKTRDSLLADVGALYDNSARAPEPLLLPFQASCWTARVDHTELTMPIEGDGALKITMDF